MLAMSADGYEWDGRMSRMDTLGMTMGGISMGYTPVPLMGHRHAVRVWQRNGDGVNEAESRPEDVVILFSHVTRLLLSH